jgi:hypothetical protein
LYVKWIDQLPNRIVEKMAISFSINTTNKGLWRTLANNEYEDSMQPISEIIDNSIAAKSTLIKITIDFDKNYGSIEDNGVGFPTKSEDLSRCFTYSPDVRFQTDLNEHGCGLKSSLAILDPHDSAWKITWKNGGKIYKVEAPYARPEHSAIEVNLWPGTIQDPTGTFIEFPIQKIQFQSLYEKKNTSMANVLPKLRDELSQYWMKHPRMVSGILKMYLNDEHITPFIVPHDDTNYVTSVKNFSGTLTSGAKVEGSHYVLAKHIPNSWFRKTINHNGIYMFKNGRIIQKVNSGSLYRQITGTDTNTNLNGNIVIMNVSGKPDALPITVPTKNKFKPSHNPLFDELITFLKKEINFEVTCEVKKSEEELVKKFETVRTKAFKNARGIKHQFLVKEQLNFKGDNLNSPQIDAVEIINNVAMIYEAKRENKVALCHLSQLYSNWILSIDAVKEQYPEVDEVVPVLIINTNEGEYTLPEGLKSKIRKLHEVSKYGFPIEVRNYENDEIFKFEV